MRTRTLFCVSALLYLTVATAVGSEFVARPGFEHAKSDPRFEHPKTPPSLFMESANPDLDMQRLGEDGYVLIGTANLPSAAPGLLQEKAHAIARSTGASVVLVHLNPAAAAPPTAEGIPTLGAGVPPAADGTPPASGAATAGFYIRQDIRQIHFGANTVKVPDDVRLHMSRSTGVYVQSVIRGTPAFEGGLQHGDVILQVSGLEVTDAAFLRDRLDLFGGMTVDVLVLRDGVMKTLNITLRQ